MLLDSNLASQDFQEYISFFHNVNARKRYLGFCVFFSNEFEVFPGPYYSTETIARIRKYHLKLLK